MLIAGLAFNREVLFRLLGNIGGIQSNNACTVSWSDEFIVLILSGKSYIHNIRVMHANYL